MQASGLCHTDLLFATHDIVPTPSVLGHEVAGVVAEVGPDVVQIRVGDHVVGSLVQSCGACARCLSGHSLQRQHPESTLTPTKRCPALELQRRWLFQGFGLGGFAEQALIHENQLAVVPKEILFAQAALLGCGVVTGAGAVLNTASVSAGDTVVIFGAGGVGLNTISGARIAGASRIVVIDIQEKRLAEARRFGATDVIDSTKSKPVEAVRDLLPGGADHVFDFVGLKVVAEEGLGRPWIVFSFKRVSPPPIVPALTNSRIFAVSQQGGHLRGKGDLSLSEFRLCYESCPKAEAARITEIHLPVRFTNEAAACRHLGHIVRTNTAPASGLAGVVAIGRYVQFTLQPRK